MNGKERSRAFGWDFLHAVQADASPLSRLNSESLGWQQPQPRPCRTWHCRLNLQLSSTLRAASSGLRLWYARLHQCRSPLPCSARRDLRARLLLHALQSNPRRYCSQCGLAELFSASFVPVQLGRNGAHAVRRRFGLTLQKIGPSKRKSCFFPDITTADQVEPERTCLLCDFD